MSLSRDDTRAKVQRARNAERYAQLVMHLGDMEDRRYGWQSRAARRLGVTASYINQIAHGTSKNIGRDVIDRAGARLGVPRSWFDDPNDTPVPPLTQAEPRATVVAGAEFAVMQALDGLDGKTRARVLRWATDRWGGE